MGARRKGTMDAKTASATKVDESLSWKTTHALPRSAVQSAMDDAVVDAKRRLKSRCLVAGSARWIQEASFTIVEV
jgi:hypothetical protein